MNDSFVVPTGIMFHKKDLLGVLQSLMHLDATIESLQPRHVATEFSQYVVGDADAFFLASQGELPARYGPHLSPYATVEADFEEMWKPSTSDRPNKAAVHRLRIKVIPSDDCVLGTYSATQPWMLDHLLDTVARSYSLTFQNRDLTHDEIGEREKRWRNAAVPGRERQGCPTWKGFEFEINHRVSFPLAEELVFYSPSLEDRASGFARGLVVHSQFPILSQDATSAEERVRDRRIAEFLKAPETVANVAHHCSRFKSILPPVTEKYLREIPWRI